MPRGGSVGSLPAIAIELHQLDVVVRRPVDQLEIGIRQRSARLRGASHHEGPSRDPRPRGHECAGGDDGLVLHHDPVQHDRTDGDQAVRAHSRAVQMFADGTLPRASASCLASRQVSYRDRPPAITSRGTSLTIKS